MKYHLSRGAREILVHFALFEGRTSRVASVLFGQTLTIYLFWLCLMFKASPEITMDNQTIPMENIPIGIKMPGQTQPIIPPLAHQGILLCLFETGSSKSLAKDFTGFIGDIQA